MNFYGGEHIQMKAFSSSSWLSYWMWSSHWIWGSPDFWLSYTFGCMTVDNVIAQSLHGRPNLERQSSWCSVHWNSFLFHLTPQIHLTALLWTFLTAPWIPNNVATILVRKSPGEDVPVRCRHVYWLVAYIHELSVSADWECEMLWLILQQCAYSMTALKWSLFPSTCRSQLFRW